MVDIVILSTSASLVYAVDHPCALLALDRSLISILLERVSPPKNTPPGLEPLRQIIVLSEGADLIEKLLQQELETITLSNVTICLATNPSTPLTPLQSFLSTSNEQKKQAHRVLLASPSFIPATITKDLLYSGIEWQATWKGERKRLALISADMLFALKENLTEEQVWQEIARSTEPYSFDAYLNPDIQPAGCIESIQDLYNYQLASLKHFPTHIGQEAVIHPTAHLIPPFFIGQHAQIASGAEIGPWAVIQPHARVGSGTSVTKSVITTCTQVGEALEVDSSCIFGAAIYRKDLEAWGRIDKRLSDFKGGFGSIKGWNTNRICLLNRALGLLLLTVTWPIIQLLRYKHAQKISWIFIPQTSCSEWELHHLTAWYDSKDPLTRFLVNLPLLVQGYISLIGITPKNKSQWDLSSISSRESYTGKQMGLILPQALELSAEFPAQFLEVLERYYILTKTTFGDFCTFLAFCKNCLKRTLKKIISRFSKWRSRVNITQ